MLKTSKFDQAICLHQCKLNILDFKLYKDGDKSFQVEPVDKSVYKWTVRISNFDFKSKIFDQMMQLERLER